ncbi:hypothetical protein KP509_39G009100 [Ceratopteris richardii]|uniref:CCHC-type domain-containing protein n=1 Tax=Ceratopteris richardii TaxID=49495 RepID=A0A8T2PY87_CERRI|nr:hypothetical protein KP509_39G009100 [Ceratopteris richardii]
MKLFFLWPRLRHDISRRVRNQGPPTMPRSPSESTPIPMDIDDVQNAQTTARRSLPARDAKGCPKCFFCNNYGHVKKHCRKLRAQQHHQNAQIELVGKASLAELPGNL